MFRRSIKLPVVLGVVMIVLLVALIVGWVVMSVSGALTEDRRAPLYWTLLPIGAASLVVVLVGVVLYLSLSVKAINLARNQSNFMDSVTHELKSPIASLKLYLQTLNRHNVSHEQRENFYKFMLDDVERLDSLINHLLDAARLDRRPVDDETENIRLHELIANCVQTICLQYHVPPQAVQMELTPVVLRARRVDLDMIIRNLIDNAVKYAGDEPKVEIALTASGDKAWFRISDNGRGIPPEQRRKIFGRFVRLGLELERDKPGTGLGLHIVRTLVARLKGKIRVSGRDRQAGTTFEVQLPGAQPLPASTIPEQKREAEVA